MIVADNLTKRFGKLTAVDSINFRIPRGQVVGFLGPNGAGKSTTIRMITGFVPPTAGSVTVDGLDVGEHPIAVRRRIGYLPESTPLYPEMRVVEYLRMRASLFGVPRRRRRSAIDGAIGRCAIQDVRRRPIGQLSKGYRQRVGLAAALLHEPPVLILDEPTAGLDPAQIRDVRQLIRELAGRHTILLSTHVLPEAELCCDEVLMMAAGRVLAAGRVERLRESLARDSHYVVETDSADAGRFLLALPSIADVETTTIGEWTRLTVTEARGAGDCRELIGRTLRQQGAAVRELRREAPSLEHLFMRLLADEAATETGAAPHPSVRRTVAPRLQRTS